MTVTCYGCLVCRKPERLVNVPALKAAGIPLIKRFSGGGTVVVDRDTVFATLIMEGALRLCLPQHIPFSSRTSFGLYDPPHRQMQPANPVSHVPTLREGHSHGERLVAGSSLPEVECYPRPIMAWTECFYSTVFGPHGDFSLRGHGGRRHLRCAMPRRMLGE